MIDCFTALLCACCFRKRGAARDVLINQAECSCFTRSGCLRAQIESTVIHAPSFPAGHSPQSALDRRPHESRAVGSGLLQRLSAYSSIMLVLIAAGSRVGCGRTWKRHARPLAPTRRLSKSLGDERQAARLLTSMRRFKRPNCDEMPPVLQLINRALEHGGRYKRRRGAAIE